MKLVFLAALVINSFSAYCQLHDDSLKSICIKRYQEDILAGQNSFLIREIKTENLTGEIQELFNGYFDNIKVFHINYKLKEEQWIIDDDPNSYPRVYAFDRYTGKGTTFENCMEFNSAISKKTANKAMCNLDKCYLYLLLSGISPFEIVNPQLYRKGLALNSVFVNNSSIFQNLCGTCSWPGPTVSYSLITRDINNANKRNIKVYIISRMQSINATHRYTFVFDKNGDLVDTRIENIVGVSTP